MRIQLVHPPVFLNVRALTALRPAPPLGLAYVAGALRAAGHEVAVLDAVALGVEEITPDGALHRLGLSVEEIVERLDPRAEVIGVGNMWSFSWPIVRDLLRRIRMRCPDAFLVGGGEHFTALPEASMREAPLDAVVLGEGEETIVELCESLAQGSPLAEVRGLALRIGSEIVRTEPRARLAALAGLPRPAWDLFDLPAYNSHALVSGLRGGFTVPILATRGCPYSCTYCSSPSMWGTRWVAREPADVADEIAHYHRTLGADNFPFHDLTAILKRDWILAFCAEMKRRSLRIRWQLPSGTRCEVIDEEVAAALKETGGTHLAFAPESGSDAVRERIQKRMKREPLLRAVRAAARRKLSLSCFFVIGFPEDSAADLGESVRLARSLARLGATDIAVGYFFPIPNTQLHRELEAAGRVRLTDDFLMTPMFANDPFLKARNNYCRSLPAWNLSFFKHWIVTNFYAVSFALRPWRAARILWNAARGVETCKLETFLVELKRKFAIWRRFRPRAAAAARAPARASGAPARAPVPTVQ